MKRKEILKRLRMQAKNAGLPYAEEELTRHTAIQIGSVRSFLGRHAEIDDKTARKFFDQFADVFGRGWWR